MKLSCVSIVPLLLAFTALALTSCGPRKPPKHAPAAPTSLSGFATSNAAALFWIDNSNDELGFRVERAPDLGGAPGEFAPLTELAANSTQHQDSTLVPGTACWYRVRAFHASKQSGATAALRIVLPGGGNQPAAPTQLDASGSSSSSVHVAWTDNATNEDGFQIERAPDLGGAPGAFQLVGINAANDVDFDDPQLAASTTVWYRVRAFRATLVSTYSNADTATTLPSGGAGHATRFGTAGQEVAFGSATIAAETAVAGSIDWSVSGRGDAWAVRRAESGSILWQKAFVTSGAGLFSRVVATLDGGLLFGGAHAYDPDQASGDAWLVKTNAFGQPVWQFRYDFGLAEKVVDIEALPNGHFLVAGSSLESASGGPLVAQGWLMELDSAAAIVWARVVDPTRQFLLNAMDRASNGDIALCGMGFDTNAMGTVVLRLNASGVPLWTRSFGTALVDFGYGVDFAPDGTLWVAGTVYRADGSDFEAFAAHLSSQGLLLAARSLDLIVTEQDFAFSVRALADGGAVLAGNSILQGSFSSLAQEWVARLDAGAALLWSRAYGGSDLDTLSSIRVESNGEFVACGTTTSYSQWGSTADDFDAWVLRIQPDGDCGTLEQVVAVTSATNFFTDEPASLSTSAFNPTRNATSVTPVNTDAQ